MYNRGIHTGVGLPEAQRRHVSMKKNIITISREFGSGGRTIGKTVAERLGVPGYD